MIIECINCFKKFDVDQSLIPDSGRQIQCGSCNHIWFFKKKKTTSEKKDSKFFTTDKAKKIKTSIIEKDNYEISKSKNLKKNKHEKKTDLSTKSFKKSNFTINYIISILIVIIISFIALIIVLDTFETPLINLYPGLELLLFNLFETLKDIFLFVKNLIL